MNKGTLYKASLVRDAVRSSKNRSQALRSLGLTAHSDNFRRLREACVRYGIKDPWKDQGSPARESAWDNVDRFREAAESSKSRKELLDRMGLAASSKSYALMERKATEYGVKLPKKSSNGLRGRDRADVVKMVREQIASIPADELSLLMKESGSLKAFLYSRGLSRSTANYRWLLDLAKKMGASLPPEQARRGRTISDEDYFVTGVRRDTASMRKRIREGDLIPHDECANCGIGEEWKGAFLRLQIDHIDGDHFNNLLSNLRFLCPNCHSQTDTFCTPHSRRL